VQPGWALGLVAFAFMMALLIARVVAETGMPFIRLYENPLTLMRLAPIAWLAPITVYMTSVIHFLFTTSSRVNATAVAVHSLGLDEHASPRRQARFGTTLIASLVVGLIIAGGAHLVANYRNSVTLDGQPLNDTRSSELDSANSSIQELGRGQLSEVPYNRYLHLGFGAALSAVLYYLCLTFPQWPLHPFGLMLIDSYAGHEVYASVFFGWLLQVVVVRFGGASLYRKVRPLFLGLIVGEVVAAIFWALVPVVLVMFGLPYRRVHILPP